MDALTYRITTLGCRANHAESREIESLLRSRGLQQAPEGRAADIEVIHSCSVTNTAAAKSRHAIRRAGRRSRNADAMGEVLVTGCYAGTDPEQAAAIGTRTLAPHAEDGSILLDRFAQQIDQWLGSFADDHHRNSLRASFGSCSEKVRKSPAVDPPPNDTSRLLPLPVFPPIRQAGRHVRAELRIQDGCDAHCTFCILPNIRPLLRTKPVADVVDEAKQLVDLGHKEIVLTGIFIGAYGHETALRRKQRHRYANPLADLIDAVAQVPGLQRLRLSSMEPGDVDEMLLDAMVANEPVLVPHLHLPLQSGSDEILRRMNRQYRVNEYIEMIDSVNQWLTIDGLPPAITTDIICGFPGETEQDFQRTIAVARRVGYLHMHVFPFSPKRGTAAARWKDRFINPSKAKERVRTLIDLETDPRAGFSMRYRSRLRDRTVRVILEQPDRDQPGFMTGRCDHYALLHVRTNRPRGTLMHCRVQEVTSSHTIAEPTDVGLHLPVLS